MRDTPAAKCFLAADPFTAAMFSTSILCVAAAATTSPISRISARARWFVDEHGRVRFFRGFNDVPNDGKKNESTGNFTGSNYLPRILTKNETRLATLVDEYGFNCFRIMAGWAAVNPAPGVMDSKYIAALLNVTRLLARHGAHSILDMHQDGLSTRFGSSYDGAPRWVVDRTQPRHPYPWPARANGSLSAELTEADGQAYGEIYDDTHGGRTAWSQAWRAFATTFRLEPSILAYELINEPWAGDAYHDPALLLPGVAGRRSLQPAYDAIAAAIREVDDATMLMYEPVTWGMVVGRNGSDVDRMLSSGFTHVPGGAGFANRSAFSFHYYCWFGQGGDHGAPYPPLRRAACDSNLGLGRAVFDAVDETITRLGGSSMLTEFGGAAFTPDASRPKSTATLEAEWVLHEADARMQSWTFWDLSHFFDYPAFRPGCTHGDSDCRSLKYMSRPYAQAVAGTPLAMHFDTVGGAFTVCFAVDPLIYEPTVIFLPPHRYPAGYDVAIQPAGTMQWTPCGAARPNTICVSSVLFAGTSDKAREQTNVTVLVSRGAPLG